MLYLINNVSIKDFIEIKNMEYIGNNKYELRDNYNENSIQLNAITREILHTGFDDIILKWLHEGYIVPLDPNNYQIFPHTFESVSKSILGKNIKKYTVMNKQDLNSFICKKL